MAGDSYTACTCICIWDLYATYREILLMPVPATSLPFNNDTYKSYLSHSSLLMNLDLIIKMCVNHT